MCGCLCSCCVFFFKQKTAYDMRISDWSSDVCSSDLLQPALSPDRHEPSRESNPDGVMRGPAQRGFSRHRRCPADRLMAELPHCQVTQPAAEDAVIQQIGRASCRERVCQYV